MIQQTIDASQSEMFLQSLELNIESELTQFPAIESFTADVYSPAWPEPASETEPAEEIEAETPGGDESDSTPSEQPRSRATNRIDPPQTTSLRPHARHSGWVLDRVLVALHGVTRQ